MADFAKPLSKLVTSSVAATPTPGRGVALDPVGLVPAEALGTGATGSSVFLAGDRAWRTVAGGGTGADGGVGIVASNTTWSTGTITISGFGAATVNTAANLVRVSVPVQSAQTGISGVAASNTTYTSGTLTITGVGGGVTVSSNTGQRVDISVAAPVAQTVQTQNMVAVSASNTLFTSGTVTITGSNAVAVNTSAAQGVVIDVSRSVAAIVASNQTYTSGTVVFTASGDATVSNAIGQSVIVSVPSNGLTYFDNAGAVEVTNGLASTAMTFNTLLVQPLTPFNENFPGKMTVSTAMMQFSISATASSSHSSTVGVGIYTRNNATQLSLLNSAQTTWAQGAATNQTASYHGLRWITLHSSLWSASPTFSQGQYWMAMFVRSSNASHTGSFIGQFLQGQVQRSGSIMSSVATNTQLGYYPFMGIHSVSQTSFPATLAHSDINKAHALANLIPNVVFNNITGGF